MSRIPSSGRLVALVAMAALTFAAAESGVRLMLVRPFENEIIRTSDAIQRSDRNLGWVLTPHLRQQVLTRDGEVVTYATDEHGWRVQDPGRPARLDAETLFVGDSFVFGVASATTIAEQYAQLTGTEAINAGVPGYGTDQAFLAMRRAFEIGATPRTVIYGYFGNDLQNNVSRESIHVEPGAEVLHKPILDLQARSYVPADVAANDMTRRGAPRGLVEDLGALLGHSKALRGLGRVVKYRLLTSPRPAPVFDKAARESLGGNLDQFDALLRERHTRFVVLQIDGAGDSDGNVGEWLSTWAAARGATYVRPRLERQHYLRFDPHLSATGAAHVAAELAQALSPR